MFLGGAKDGWPPGPKKIVAKLRVKLRVKLRRALVDSGGGDMHLANYVDEVLQQRAVHRACDVAPHVPVAGTSTASTSKEDLEVDPSPLDDIIAFARNGCISKYSFWIPVRSENHLGFWDAFRNARIGVMRVDKGGWRGNEAWADVRADLSSRRRSALLDTLAPQWEPARNS